MAPPELDSSVEALKALADATRLRILALLMERGELCVCEVVELLACTSSNLSFHLRKLSGAGLIRARKVGKWILYSPDLETVGKLRNRLSGFLDPSRVPDAPIEGSLAAVCLEGDIPLSLAEAKLLSESGRVTVGAM